MNGNGTVSFIKPDQLCKTSSKLLLAADGLLFLGITIMTKALYFCVLLFTRCHPVVLYASEDVFSEMSELTDLCPYTSFCNKNASSPFPFPDMYQPCCQPCSCHPDCGFKGDCCFSYLDNLYTEGSPSVVCKSSFEVEPRLEEIPEVLTYRYRMINVCKNNITESKLKDTHCEYLSSNSSETFHPVVSRRTGFVYVNAFCAECNGDLDIVPWRRAVTCSKDTDVSLFESLERLVSGQPSGVVAGCHVYYIPPFGFDIAPDKFCNPYLITTCSSALNTDKDVSYKDLCGKFNATFTILMNTIVRTFANVYCFLCNTEKRENRSEIENKLCLKSDNIYDIKVFSGSRLTVLLDMPASNQIIPSELDEEKRECPVNSVVVSSISKECRQLRCPNGQMMMNNRCGYYNQMWVGGPFSVMLRLSPVKKNAYIPTSFFHHLPGDYMNDPRAPWIKRKTLRRWKFLVLYHPFQDKPDVEYIVVKATYPSLAVNPQNLNSMIERALQDTWQVMYMNTSYDFMIAFNDYLRYAIIDVEKNRTPGINITHPFECYPSWVFCIGNSTKTSYYKELLVPVFTFSNLKAIQELRGNEGIPITELFFCEQIDLLPTEYSYDYPCKFLFIKVNNISVHNFDIVGSPVTEASATSISSETPKPIVRVCFHEFSHKNNAALETRYNHSVLVLSVYMTTCIYVIFDSLIQ